MQQTRIKYNSADNFIDYNEDCDVCVEEENM